MGKNLVPHIKEMTYIEGDCEQGADENIWIEGERNMRWLEKTA
jgi:hypothetical protein